MPNKQAGTEQFTAPKLVPEAEFKEIKAESVKIYAYANRVLTKACAEQEIKSWGFALFDQHGCLLKLYGPAGYLEWCRERGICVRSCWDRASFGRNAISLGLEQRCPLLSAGEENESPLLRSASIFFEPLLLERSENSADYELLGGIAAISPVEEPVAERKLICTALANDIELHMFMASELYALYFQEPKGLINIDINVVTGNPHILYHNEQVFRILGIPYENLYFKKAETLFDPLPQNQEFWDIIRNIQADQNVCQSR